VLKESRARLVPAIERALREAEDRDARRWAQRELEESEERFRFAMHFSPVGMALVAPDGRWLGTNPALCAIVGYSEKELLATDVQSITYPDDRDADTAQVRQMLRQSVRDLSSQQALRPQGRARRMDAAERLAGLAAIGRTALFHLSNSRHHGPVNAERRCAPAKNDFAPSPKPPGMDLGNRC